MIYSYRDDERNRIEEALESNDPRQCLDVLGWMFFGAGEVKKLINVVRDGFTDPPPLLLNRRNQLTFGLLRAFNVARLPLFKDRKGRTCHTKPDDQPDGFDWALSQWSNAVCGELGEAANLIKKIERGDMTLDEARVELGKELADVQVYLDLLAHRAGVDLGAATVAKWNEVSERIGIALRMPDALHEAIESGRCAYCGSAYTIADAGCVIKCPNSQRAAAFVASVFERADLP